MGVYLPATRLVKLLEQVRRTESTSTNEIKNQNTSSALTEARPLYASKKFKKFKGLLCIFPNSALTGSCITLLLHNQAKNEPQYPLVFWKGVGQA